MANIKKTADIFLINKRSSGRTMIPCPYCMTFHSVNEYLSTKNHWRSDTFNGFMSVMVRSSDTQCPVCRGIFRLNEHKKMLDNKGYRTVYFTVPKKFR